ncbi:MAG: class I SAM-dependent methyltransferase [Bacteroidetes bacterium]|nr:MAG: class I SAM-dependent methyltransferase [Bacteroidota bacterium]MBL1145259.1 class I SAM-dependent methyltransferase [Bacteroidota bacterium]NOG58055.1 class I SAM-dependent methyltransferase [Bacteroidota bacterium]
MKPYSTIEENKRKVGEREVFCFGTGSENIDLTTVESFGEEWLKFDAFSKEEIKNAGDQYFDIVSENALNKSSYVLDLGCGSGRWTKYMADKAGFIEAIDPSEAVFSACKHYGNLENVRFTQAGVDTIPFDDNTFDFVISLGVLHHIPDTGKALKSLIKKLKPNGFALIYLYYALDNRGFLYKAIFNISTLFRKIISSLPHFLKQFICDLIAVFIYLPFIALSKLLKVILGGSLYLKVPLAYYRDKSWNIIRNDALDRFGTPLEQRFTKMEIQAMLEEAGMKNIVFSENEPYWHVLAQKI